MAGPYTLQDIRREYDRLDGLSGVDTSGVELKISSRMVKRLGSFRYPRDPDSGEPLRITISRFVLENDEQFWDTIRHEYAQAAVYLRWPGEHHGHDDLWREMCRVVGCVPKSTAPAGEAQAALRRSRAKYMIRCGGCGQESYYLRAGVAVGMMLRGQGQQLLCARCGSRDLRLFTRQPAGGRG